jgi:hypothetical protein
VDVAARRYDMFRISRVSCRVLSEIIGIYRITGRNAKVEVIKEEFRMTERARFGNFSMKKIKGPRCDYAIEIYCLLLIATKRISSRNSLI